MPCRVPVACERSGRVRRAINALHGRIALSTDLLPTDDLEHSDHYCGDVLSLLSQHWDLLIAFPPCTHLAASGARYFSRKRNSHSQDAAIEFFLRLAHAPIKHIAIENPIGIMSRLFRRPDQIVQPWQFGDPASKATCLWLKNLPLLRPTAQLDLPPCGHWPNQTPTHQNSLPPGPYRAKLRGLSFPGIATAMASQWLPLKIPSLT